ncbi:MAG: trimethylamine methyltransferase family protein [Deltaproteobacteria bacterium]|nr:trimethylamine methyltransferase family protein [Deltaproteobacteria bacterium]
MEFINRPTLRLLSEESKRRIHEAVLELLSEAGMQVFQEDALTLLKNSGCPVHDGNIVKIPGEKVTEAMQNAPKRIRIHDRKGDLAMDLGGDRSYYGLGSDLLYTLDPEDGIRRRSTLEDVRRAARVADALSNIDFIMSFAHPSDIPPANAYLKSFQAMAESSTKPIVCTAEGVLDLQGMYAIAGILRGGEEALQEKPYFIHYAEPTSPRKHPVKSLEKLLFCAEKGIPVVYSPAPLAGATAPITIAGHVAQGLAECFCGLVIHQSKSNGAPFLMGMGPAVMDMATAQSSYNAPEYLLAYMAVQEMGRFYDLPTWGYAGTCDTHIPDGQAVFEAGLCTFLSAMLGSNLNHDVGYMDFGRTGSLEMLVLLDEVIDQCKRFHEGVPVNEETLALDVIREVGFNGHFLGQRHTLENLSKTQWRPKLMNRAGFEAWDQAGRPTFQENARKKLRSILETHQPLPIPEEKAARIRELAAGLKAV